MNKYDFNHDADVIIYGAASTGILLKKMFDKEGVKVKAFIDKRANEINCLEGIPVVSIEKDEESLRECIVVVAVKNVFEHNKIAQTLIKRGYNKIIFKPYSVLRGRGTEEQNKLSLMWDLIISKHKLMEETLICAMDAIGYAIINDSLISNESGLCICRVPVDLINTDLHKRGNSDWADIPIKALYPHIYFFKNLLGYKSYSIKPYIDFCIDAAKRVGNIEITESWKDSVIRNRVQTFQEMKMSMSIDPEFFIRNAVKVTWNNKGYFNLNSGKHRVAFLVALGHTYIPVTMTEKDYITWCNETKAKKLHRIMKDKDIYSYDNMIMNPFFYNIPNNESYYEDDFLFYVMQVIQSEVIKKEKKLKVLLNVRPNHRLIYLLSRMNIELDYICRYEEDELDKKIKDLCNLCIKQGMKYEHYDYVISDSEKIELKASKAIFIADKPMEDGKYLILDSYKYDAYSSKYLLMVDLEGKCYDE